MTTRKQSMGDTPTTQSGDAPKVKHSSPAGEPDNGRFRNYFQDAYQSIETTVQKHPAASMLVPFALGIGAGLLIGLSVGPAVSKKRDDEWFGRRLIDSLAERLPDALGQRLKS